MTFDLYRDGKFVGTFATTRRFHFETVLRQVIDYYAAIEWLR